MRRKFHARCGAGEKPEVKRLNFLIPEVYLSLLGKIPEFPQKISTCRKYNISTTIVLQSIAQIKMLYKDDFETIIGNCDTAICLGTNEQTTADYFSKKLGKATIRAKNRSFSVGGKGGANTSINQTSRELMLPDEIMTMPFDECIVMMNHIDPFYDKKFPLESHPQFQYTGDGSSDNFYYLENDDDFLCVDTTKECGENVVDMQFNGDNEQENNGKYIPKNLKEMLGNVLDNRPDIDNYFRIKDVDPNIKQSLLTVEREKMLDEIAKCIEEGYKTPFYDASTIEPSIVQPLVVRTMKQLQGRIDEVVCAYDALNDEDKYFSGAAKTTNTNGRIVFEKMRKKFINEKTSKEFRIYDVQDKCDLTSSELKDIKKGFRMGEDMITDRRSGTSSAIDDGIDGF